MNESGDFTFLPPLDPALRHAAASAATTATAVALPNEAGRGEPVPVPSQRATLTEMQERSKLAAATRPGNNGAPNAAVAPARLPSVTQLHPPSSSFFYTNSL